MVGREPAGAASRRSLRLAAKTSTASFSADCRSRIRSVDAERDLQRRPPRPAHGVEQPAVGGPAAVGDTETCGDAALVVRRLPRLGLVGIGSERQREHLFLLAAQHREDAVRRKLGERLGELEVVRELRAVGLLARADGRVHAAAAPHQLAQFTDEVGVLREALDEDGAGTVELLVRSTRRDRWWGPDRERRRRVRGRPRARSAPWCAAWACRAGRCPRAGPWCRRAGSGRAGRRRVCPGPRSIRGSRCGARRVRAGTAAARRGCGAGRRRVRR